MWLFTSGGFISVVQHSEKPETLIVRARDEDSLLSLVGATGATLRHTPSNDYPYRIEALREAFSAWVADQVFNLDYTNYKAHMWSQRPEFGDALHDVWVAMHQVTPNRVTQEDRDEMARLYSHQREWTDEEIEMAKALGHL
jgi:hypothetical protein